MMLLVGWDLQGGEGELSLDRGWGSTWVSSTGLGTKAGGCHQIWRHMLASLRAASTGLGLPVPWLSAALGLPVSGTAGWRGRLCHGE